MEERKREGLKPYLVPLIVVALAVIVIFISIQVNKDKGELDVQRYLRENAPTALDTIKVVKADSVNPEAARIAYADIKFGMRRNEVENLLRKLKGKEGYLEIADFDYTVKARYNNDSLYLLDFMSLPRDADYYHTRIAEAYRAFEDVLTKKYGIPQEGSGFPQFYHMEKGRVVFGATWNASTKTIRLGAAQSEYTFYVECWIYDRPTYDRVQAAANANEEASHKDAAKRF